MVRPWVKLWERLGDENNTVNQLNALNALFGACRVRQA